MEVFLRVSFHRDFFQPINGIVLTDFNERPVLEYLVSTEFSVL